MKSPFVRFSFVFALVLAATSPARAFTEDDDLAALEEQAMQAAVDRVTASVVSIETVGGVDRVGRVLAGTGATSALAVTADGYLVSSAFNFAQKPASILATLADGTRLPARLVATDHQRMIVLLKVDPPSPLPVPEATPQAEMKVGQWAIAIGRAFDGSLPNISTGIVSALDRVWGKALQTDVKASPSNYGGPLVDIRGRVLGVLVPLSPQEEGETAGVEWYDSGIGFAVPLEHILNKLPQMQAGTDLRGGLIGVSLKGTDMYADAPTIGAVRPKSPAYAAGLKPGDVIVAVDGASVTRHVQLLHHINRRYAGETIKVTIARGEERLERDITLVERLDPYQRAFLGLLPMRDGAPGPTGVAVRYVYADSPAARAGLQAGDLIVSLDGAAIDSRQTLLEKASALEPGKTARLEIIRGVDRQTIDIVCAVEPYLVPDKLPVAWDEASLPSAAPVEAAPTVGESALKLPEFKNECSLFVPEDYDPKASYGLMIWLAAPTDREAVSRLAAWRPFWGPSRVIVMAPRPASTDQWQKEDAEFIRKACDQVRKTYRIDPQRVVAFGEEVGGAIAAYLGFQHRDLIRGVAMVNAPPGPRPPDNDPIDRLTLYVAAKEGLPATEAIRALVAQLREMKFSVTVKSIGGKHLGLEEVPALFRWIDSLDKI